MTKSGAGTMKLEDLTYPQYRSPNATLNNMIEGLLNFLHDKKFTEEQFNMIFQIPITHQIKCFLDKSLKSISKIKECIEKIEKYDLADDYRMY